MPLKEIPKYRQQPDKQFEIPQPAIGGLNLKDLEFEQEVNQSPYCLNMMYRNGSFSKRYGQEVYKINDKDMDYGANVYALAYYRSKIIVHAGNKLFVDDEQISGVTLKEVKGMFATFNRFLYYFQPPVIKNITSSTTSTKISNIRVNEQEYTRHYTITKTYKYNGFNWKTGENKVSIKSLGVSYDGDPQKDDTITITITKESGAYWQYNGVEWKEVEPYVPDLVINRKPDGSYSDVIESYNMIGSGFKNTFHGDGTSKEYVLTSKGDELENKKPKIWFDVEEDEKLQDESTYSFDKENGKITFNTAPPKGTNNVIIEAFYSEEQTDEYRDKILKSKYSINFGGSNNSSLFLAGGGESIYYYSEVFDATYFPEKNYASVGDTADDITGFGLQYNVLIVFKPREIYQLMYYIQTSETTAVEDEIGIGAYEMIGVNNMIGCDAPNTIQLINNRLTWFNSNYGVCTLVSTNIQNERNVIPISRNIDNTNNFGIVGILDMGEDLDTIKSIDYDNKYFLVFPKSGICFAWDYKIRSFYQTSTREANPKELDWYRFNNFYVGDFLLVDRKLIYRCTHERFENKLITLNDTFNDLDFDGDGHLDGIEAYYMTPFLQFDAVAYLKTIKNIYVQVRGDTSSVIDMYYYTEESKEGDQEPDSIRIGTKIWSHFAWDNFQWLQVNWANTFRRKCSLKKVQMCSFLFKNNEAGRDMSISHISLQYQIIKTIK